MRSFSWGIVVCLIVEGSLLAQNAPANKPHPIEVTGMPPRSAPTDYPAHTQVGNVTIAAEFAGHSIPRPEDPLSTDDYVVVEAGVFGPTGARLTLSLGDFSLRINGKKNPLASEPFVLVSSSLRDPEWVAPDQPKGKPKTSFGGGGGNDTTTLPPKIPLELQRSMTQYIEKVSLPEGDRALPQAGLL